MRSSYLCHCSPGDLVEDVFVITNKQFSAASNGKNFIKAFVSDKTTQVTARLWNATRQLFDALPDGGFARIRGKVENYQNNLQLIIEQVWPAKEGTYDLADLIPHTAKDIPAMCRRLQEVVQSVQNRHLAALLQAYLDDRRLMDDFRKAPAAMSFHHAYLGGLLEHTLNAIEVADAVCRFYPGINRDLVVAGLFLHDVAKTWELTYDCSFGYSDGGQLVGHIVKSAVWVEQKRLVAEEILGEKVPQELIDVLQHIILAHHGPLDRGFGSARTPCTPEAWMVHFIDEMDAKLTLSLQVTRGEAAQNVEGRWTEYMKAFAGRLYRPDVAPADAEPADPPPDGDAPQPPEPRAAAAPVPPPPPPARNGKDDKRPTLSNPLFEILPTKKG